MNLNLLLDLGTIVDLCKVKTLPTFNEIAKLAKFFDAKPLLDVMVFPNSITLQASAKNIYRVLPLGKANGELVADTDTFTSLIVCKRLFLRVCKKFKLAQLN